MFDILSRPPPRSRGGYVEIIKSIRGHVSELNAEQREFCDDVERSKFRVSCLMGFFSVLESAMFVFIIRIEFFFVMYVF